MTEEKIVLRVSYESYLRIIKALDSNGIAEDRELARELKQIKKEQVR